MNAAEITEKLKPKADQIEAGLARLASAGMSKTARRRYASAFRADAREDLEEEAAKLGLGVGFFASILLRWVISRLVAKIMKRWLE